LFRNFARTFCQEKPSCAVRPKDMYITWKMDPMQGWHFPILFNSKLFANDFIIGGIAEICGLVIWIGLWDPTYVKHNHNKMSQFIINKLAQMGWSSKAPRDTTFWKNPLQSSKGVWFF
jgi:hypothetical protein